MLQSRKKPLGALSSGYNPYENVDGIDVRDQKAVWDNMDRLGLNDPIGPTGPAAPQAPQVAPQAPQAPQGMPQTPPSVRSTNPWSKANVSRTLLDISAAFGGAQDFGEGLGRAAGAIGSRMDQLQAEATPQRKQGVGPDGSFEAITDPVTGETTYRRIPEFQKAIEDERNADLAAKNLPSREDTIDQRARAIAAIRRLPADQQAAAYQRLLYAPEEFGNIDTKGMPTTYDPMWAQVTEGMGLSTNQRYIDEARERELLRKVEADRTRAAQGQQRIGIAQTRASKPPRPRAAPKPPAGFILD